MNGLQAKNNGQPNSLPVTRSLAHAKNLHHNVSQFYISPHLTTCNTCIGCTLRSGLHEIPTTIRTFAHKLEKSHACKWISRNADVCIIPGKLYKIHLYVWLFFSPCGKVPFLLKSMGQISPLDLILLKTCPHGLENNHACKLFSDNFPGKHI